VRPAIGEAYPGLKAVLASWLPGVRSQRCGVHFLCDPRSHVAKKDQAPVAAFVRTIFAPPTEAEVRLHLARVAERLRDASPKAAENLRAAAEDILASMNLPNAPGSSPRRPP
jgi:putative transposase